MSKARLKLYYTNHCNYCQIAVDALRAHDAPCLLQPHIAHQHAVLELADGVVPILMDGDDAIMGSQSIASYISGNADALSYAENTEVSSNVTLYVKADCDYCAIVTNALAEQGVDCLMLPQQSDRTITAPTLVHGDDVISGASEIVAYLNKNFERKVFTKEAEEPKDWNMNFYELQVRYFAGFALFVYGIVGGLPADFLSYIKVQFWAMDGIAPLMGTLHPNAGYAMACVGFVLLWSAGTRKCPVYSMLGINTCETKEGEI